MKKIMLAFGTRPEAIKMAPLVHALKGRADQFETTVCATAQHREFLDQTLATFDITPDFDLNVMQPGQDLYDITTRVLNGMRDVFAQYRPDMVLVHGDTTTSFAVALAAFYQQIPVAHVEAGLRSGNLLSPFPEEANRQLTSKIARFHFSPTEANRKALVDENINADHIEVTGNTGIDALFLILEKIDSNAGLKQALQQNILLAGYRHANQLADRKILLVTGHRRENFGQGFINICSAIRTVAERHPDLDIVYPVHLNPNVKGPVHERLAGLDNVFLIEPLNYEPFVLMMKHAHLILTDSGGIQEEAPALDIPTLVMRENTERAEAVEAGTVKLVGTDPQRIVKEVEQLLLEPGHYQSMCQATNPFGDGKASQRIVQFLLNQA